MAVEASPDQVNAMVITERVTSVFSLLGIFFILSTFLLGRGFDKPINRLIFFASWSNLGTNVAALIAQNGIIAGANSALCQFQAFAIQWFLGVDALWAMCMGVNVYLALFRGWTAQRMRAQEWKYIFGCYGCSFIPALVYLFVHTSERERVYGPALLWCWVSPRWDFLRIATLYGIVWIAIGFALTIYSMAGAKIWRNRHELRGYFNPFNENPFEGLITTDIDITSTPRRPSRMNTYHQDPEASTGIMSPSDFNLYSVNIEVSPQEKIRQPSAPAEILRVRSLTRNAALSEANADAWLYARVAFLFFCALLIAWVPSSINRLYSLAHPDRLNFGLNFTETLVLPLQGFWNAIVYVITSQTACRNLWRSVTGRQELPRQDTSVVANSMALNAGKLGGSGGGGGGGKGEKKLESTLGRFTTRRMNERLRDDDDTSVTSLTGRS